MYKSGSIALNNKIEQTSRTFYTRLKLSDGSYINTSNATVTQSLCTDEYINIGGGVSSVLTATIPYTDKVALVTKVITLEIGVLLDDSTTEYITMGNYKVVDTKEVDNGNLSITAYDRLYYDFNYLYVPTDGIGTTHTIEGTDEDGNELIETYTTLTISELLADVNITVVNNCNSELLNNTIKLPKGYTYKEVLSYIAAALGGVVYVDRNDNIVISKIGTGDRLTIDGNRYYSITTSEDNTTIAGIRSGDFTSGISPFVTVNNPLLTEESFNALLGEMVGTYRAATFNILGDPRIDLNDNVSITTVENNVYNVPIMKLIHDFDGGLTTTIYSFDVSQDDNNEFTGSITQTLNRVYEDLLITKQVIATKVTAKEIETEYAKIGDLDATNAKIDNVITNDLKAINADIDDLTANKANVTDLNATNANVSSLQSDVANIGTLIFKDATGGTITVDFANAVAASFGSGVIKNAMIDNLSVDKITSGTISTNKFTIGSDDGKTVLADNTLQFSDENRVRIQIGKDSTGDYNLTLVDKLGNVLWNANGLQGSAIRSDIITNEMISNNTAISGSKIDLHSLVTEINDSTETIKASNIYFDENSQTLNIALQQLKTNLDNTESDLETLQTDFTLANGKLSSVIAESAQTKSDLATVSGQVSTNKSSISTLTQDLNGFKTTVSETYTTKIELENELSSYSTTTQMNSAIEQSKSDIKLEVSETYTTKAEFDDLAIGGRNLILKQDNDYIMYGTTTGVGVDCGVVDSTSPTGHHTYFSLPTRSTLRGIYYDYKVNSGDIDTMILNEVYTISFYARTDYTSNITLDYGSVIADQQIINHSDMTLNNNWNRYFVTFEYNNSATLLSCFYTSTATSTASKVYIAGIKIELGNKATDYIPSYKNYSTTEQTKALIKVESDKIELKVDKNGIVSAINQTAEQIKIDASKIDLNGYVTVTDLAGDGTTTINGSNISTGTIDANLVDVVNVKAENIEVGTLNGFTITGSDIQSRNYSIGSVNATSRLHDGTFQVTNEDTGVSMNVGVDEFGTPCLNFNNDTGFSYVSRDYISTPYLESYGIYSMDNIKLAKGKGIVSAYNSGSLLKDYNNGNVAVNSAGKLLHLGYENTTGIVVNKGIVNGMVIDCNNPVGGSGDCYIYFNNYNGGTPKGATWQLGISAYGNVHMFSQRNYTGGIAIGHYESNSAIINSKYIRLASYYNNTSTMTGGVDMINVSFQPVYDNSTSLGYSNKRWKQIYAATATISTSDIRYKTDIKEIDNAYNFILGLNPVQFKFKDGDSNRDHYGFIAQEVKENMTKNNIDDCALFIRSIKQEVKKVYDKETNSYIDEYENPKDENGNEYTVENAPEDKVMYALRYDEFIAPMVATIQQLKKEIEELKIEKETEIDLLRKEITELKELIKSLV